VAEHWLVCPVVTVADAQDTLTIEIVDGVLTVTVVEPNLFVSCADVAVIVAVPAADGVKTPALLTAPMVVGLTDQVTEVL
jgi:hypothetical protein